MLGKVEQVSRMLTDGVRPSFLLSLPRSGSTLLQRLLGAHSRVATVAEPWLLLPPLYALREDGVYAEYGHKVASRAVQGSFTHLPDGRRDYLDAVSTMARVVYGRMSPPTAEIFLDKTPRYGLVIEELLSTFPESPFILLYRNPLAVVASMISTFHQGSWKIHVHKPDLYLLAERLLEAQRRHQHAFTVVRYEDLVDDPQTTLTRVLGALGLEWEPHILEGAFGSVNVQGAVGDPTGVQAYDKLSAEPLTKWKSDLASPVRQAWAKRYVLWLGRDRLEMMGYDYDEILNQLHRVPRDYSLVPADLGNTVRGIIWSLAETEMAREKLRRFPKWRDIFSHL